MTHSQIGDTRFFARSGPHALAAVVRTAAGSAAGGDLCLTGLAPLQSAGPHDVSFLDNRRYIPALKETRAGAVIVHPDMSDHVPRTSVAIVTETPYEGWARVATLFYPEPAMSPGVHSSAIVEPGACVDPSAEIGAFCVIGAGAEIGARCRLGPMSPSAPASSSDRIAALANTPVSAMRSLALAFTYIQGRGSARKASVLPPPPQDF